MTLDEMVELAYATYLGLASADRGPHISDALLRAWVNQGYHRVERASTWKFSEQQQTITLPAGNCTIAGLTMTPASILLVRRESDSYELPFWDDRQGTLGPETGEPVYWGSWAEQPYVWPIPSVETDLLVRYYAVWDDLSGGDEPIFPVTWHSILVDYALAQALLRAPKAVQGEAEDYASVATSYRKQFEQGLGEMLSSPMNLKTHDAIAIHTLEWPDG